MKIIITSGYFDPLHIGHIELFNLSKKMGDKLIVIVNNDTQAALKKGRSFMPAEERMAIVQNLKPVDEVVLSIDTDRSVSKSLRMLRSQHPTDELIFTKGGDRQESEIPESATCKELNIKIVDGVGKKIQSSSWLINKVKQ